MCSVASDTGGKCRFTWSRGEEDGLGRSQRTMHVAVVLLAETLLSRSPFSQDLESSVGAVGCGGGPGAQPSVGSLPLAQSLCRGPHPPR